MTGIRNPPLETQDLALGESADESEWRALVEKGLKGANWSTLDRQTDGLTIAPLYRETDFATAKDVSGFPGAAPFIRGARTGAWLVRQAYDHSNPERANADILADLRGGVSAIELVVADAGGGCGIEISDQHAFARVLDGVLLDAAPVSLDAGARGLELAELLAAKLRGAAGNDVAYNLDPLRALSAGDVLRDTDVKEATAFAARMASAMPQAHAIRVNARIAHEAGGTPAQEVALALCSGIFYMRALTAAGLSPAAAADTLQFYVGAGPETLHEAAKLRALRLCWARITEASGAISAAHIHAVTGRRMLTRYDAWTNILRVTTAAFGAAIGGADIITTLPFTDALGLATPFARRIARNIHHVLLEEAHLACVADPAGGSWFVEKLTRDIAFSAWTKMQAIEAEGGIVTALHSGSFADQVARARQARQNRFDTRRETITGLTDFPLLDEPSPAFEDAPQVHAHTGRLAPVRWAASFEALRDRAEAAKPRPCAFFANLGAQPEFAARAQFSKNLLATGGIGAANEDVVSETPKYIISAFQSSGCQVAVINGSDAAYVQYLREIAPALKAAGCTWIIVAARPDKHGEEWRGAGVDQFIHADVNAVEALSTLQVALGLAA